MYRYFLDSIVNTNIEPIDLIGNNAINNAINNYIYILCYHVTNTTQYPFLQFMMEKIPFCDNLIKEEFVFPFVLFNNTTNIENIVIDKVTSSLKSIGIEYTQIATDFYKGLVSDSNNFSKIYAVVNITGIDITGLKLSRNSPVWFVLPSEIINLKTICNIAIDDEVIELFTRVPYVGLLTNPTTNQIYAIPDAVYTGSEYKHSEFIFVFGNVKTKEYDSCGEYYYFYKSFNDSIRYGGWTKRGGTRKININNEIDTHNTAGRLIVANEYGQYISGGVNRYALFIDGNFHIETGTEFTLNDHHIKLTYPEPTLIICYSNPHEVRPDILVKTNKSFSTLSCHSLNILSLDASYNETNNSKYMIL